MDKNNKFYIHFYSCMIMWLILSYLLCFQVPTDAQQGLVQRIFYLHVPTAWVSFISFAISFYFSIKYLNTREIIFDTKAASYVFVGWIFTTGVLVTGPLWAKPIWGSYWNWSDQRLVSFFVLWIAFTGYLLLRKGFSDIHKRARYCAVLNILGFLDVPLVYFSIRIWNTPSHPGPVIGGDSQSGLMDTEMRILLWFSFFCFILLMTLLLRVLIRSNILKMKLEEKFR